MRIIAPDPVPAPILPEEIAAVVDQQVPVVLRYLEKPIEVRRLEHPTSAMAGEGVFDLMGPGILLSQYGDRHSRYRGNEDILALSSREIEYVVRQAHPRFNAYDTAFEMSVLFECYRAAEGVLPALQRDRLRDMFRPLGERLLAERWDFEAMDSRMNVALLQAVGLGVAGWALDDERMRAESRARAEMMLAERCDENGLPSEVSLRYSISMLRWASQACEVDDRPELRRIIAGISGIAPMFIYKPTLELMGPNCRDLYKILWRFTMDDWVVALKAAAVLLEDGRSEWLSRTLFRKWEPVEEVHSGAYTPRAPRYLGCERYHYGWGAADSPTCITDATFAAADALCALKRWLNPEAGPVEPAVPNEYRSSRLYIRRYESDEDVAAVGNLIGPVSYFTPTFALQGLELWTDDHFFWWDDCGFLPTVFTDDGFSFSQAPYTVAVRRKMGVPPADRIVRAVAKCGEHLLAVVSISCSQELAPGIVSWAGLLLMDDRKGEAVFGRGGDVTRGRVCDEQTGCDWFLYPCGEGRRFGLGIVALDTTGQSHRLSNFGGDWCVLGLSQSAEPMQGLQAFAVLAIGPWEGTPEQYATWLKAWRAEGAPDRCVLVAPDRSRIELPYPPPAG